MKAFGTLVKGLRVGMDLLLLLQTEEHLSTPLLKVFKLPLFSGSDGLDKFLTQFEAAIDSDFPNYKVICFAHILSNMFILGFLFASLKNTDTIFYARIMM